MSWGLKKCVNYDGGLTLPETRAGHFYHFSIFMFFMRERLKNSKMSLILLILKMNSV